MATQQITELTQQTGKLQSVKSIVEPPALDSISQQTLALALNYQLVTDQKAEGLPQLEKIVHMQAAGWAALVASMH